MATFEAHKRLQWFVTMKLTESAPERTFRVCDDGWQILLKGWDTDTTVFTICTPLMQNRIPDRESAMAIIRVECSWWSNNQELFTPNHWTGNKG